MISNLLRRDRRGSSLTVVLLFLTVLFSMWAAVHRGTTSLILAQTAIVKHDDCDASLMNALAQRLWDLETDPSNKGDKSYSAGGKSYVVTMRPVPADSTGKQWTLHVSPAD
ncbi:MAG: hypothetical protein P4L85_03035 [Paludisphaera borealis]|uniref:hypothetical protein n=1 Tax=Paludisphaera borealis TaxID=1387353 RepID=UPI00283D7C04|nr:hypothetical protein [Paludisphaera borealis]MDR3618298.1 hypothetical protein [Paludisphaera borealis]